MYEWVIITERWGCGVQRQSLSRLFLTAVTGFVCVWSCTRQRSSSCASNSDQIQTLTALNSPLSLFCIFHKIYLSYLWTFWLCPNFTLPWNITRCLNREIRTHPNTAPCFFTAGHVHKQGQWIRSGLNVRVKQLQINTEVSVALICCRNEGQGLKQVHILIRL